jgi:hypothetical protein
MKPPVSIVKDMDGKSWRLKGNTLMFRGTTGLNDCLMGLNTAYYLSKVLDKQIHLHFFWWHDENYKFYFEDPETIIERCNYIESFYAHYGIAKVSHFFDYDVDFFDRKLHYNIERTDIGYSPLSGINNWLMNERMMNVNEDQNLTVLWKPSKTIGKIRDFKLAYDEEYWNAIMFLLRLKKFHVEEIDFRTPIKDVLYLISRARFVIGYQGSYQYVAKNLCKPSIIAGDSDLNRTHNPHAVIFRSPEKDNKDRNFQGYIREIRHKLPDMTGKVRRFRRMLKRELYAKK